MVLALIFIVAAGAAAQSLSRHGVISGCLPLTVEDGAPFHPPAFADYLTTYDFRGGPAPVDLASHPLAARFRIVVGRPLAERPLDGNNEGIFYYRWTGTALGLVRFLRSDKKWCVER